MPLTSNTVSSAVGDISIAFVGGSGTFDLIDVSPIGFKFDIQDTTQDTINDLASLLQGTTIKALNETSSGSTLSLFFSSTSQDLTLTIGSYDFPLRVRPRDYETDPEGLYINFDAFPTQNFSSVGSVVTNTVQDNDSGSSYSCTPALNAFDAYLESFGETTFVLETNHWSDTFTSTDGDEFWAIDTTNISSSYAEVQNMARIEGAVWGTGFNRGFYVYRESTANKVTITQDDILEIDQKPINRSIGDVTINWNNTGTNFTVGVINVSDTSAGTGRQTFETTADFPSIVRCFYDGTDMRLESRSDTESDNDALVVTNDGIASYLNALGRAFPFTISVRVRGFDTIKPWEPFDITDTTGRYGLFTGRTYRPFETSHSVRNFTDIKAYAIT